MNYDEPRPRIVTPRMRGFKYRNIVTVVDTVAVTEQGEVIPDPAQFAADNPGHLWMVDDPAWLTGLMRKAHGEHPCYNDEIVTSENDTDGPRFVKSRITRFGFRCKHEKDTPEREACPYRKNKAMHTVWTPGDLSQGSTKILRECSHITLLELTQDIREWCQKEDIPLPSTLAGIANSLSRDKRFWPDDRGRVPRATNENVRKYLPGVYSELRTATGTRHRAVSLDQKRAYHVAAQEVPAPDPTSLFARGHFGDPAKAAVWTSPGDTLYNRVMAQPGIVYVLVDVRSLRKNEIRPPAVKDAGRYRVALWTNEVSLCEENGVTVKGLIAAWTSTTRDEGLSRYGAYAEREVTEASAYRKRWLKPTLHSLYGLLASRPRRVHIGRLHGTADRGIARIGIGHEFTVAQCDLGVVQPVTTNVATLGTLQAEIRKRSFELARYLLENGVTVLHIHADGIHVEGELPFIPNSWKVEPLTDLEYIDKQSWTATEGDWLPGREGQARVDIARHRASVISNTIGKPGWTVPDSWNNPEVDTTPEEADHPLYWPDGTKRSYVTYSHTPARRDSSPSSNRP